MRRRALSDPSLEIDPALERDFAQRLAIQFATLRQFAILNNDEAAIVALAELEAENKAVLAETIKSEKVISFPGGPQTNGP
jgi:hypothetical protein